MTDRPTSATITYDPAVDAIYLAFAAGISARTVEIATTIALDYAADGTLLGLELLGATKPRPTPLPAPPPLRRPAPQPPQVGTKGTTGLELPPPRRRPTRSR